MLFITYGLVNAIIDPNQRAYVSDLSERKYRATALGTFHTVTGLLALPSSLLAGFLWMYGSNYTFLYGSVFSLIAFLLILIYE